MNNNENRDPKDFENDNNGSEEQQTAKSETDDMSANNSANAQEHNAYDNGAQQYSQNEQYHQNNPQIVSDIPVTMVYGDSYRQNGANYGNNNYGYGYQRDTRTPQQKYSDVFNKERPLSENGVDASIKGTPDSKKILKGLLALTLCLVFGFLGAAFGIYALSQTSLVDENSMLSKWIIDSSGIFVNKVVVERDPLEYTGGYTECAEKIVKTVVEITELKKEDDGTYTEAGYASGVIISEDGYIVTNQHVTDGVDALKVMLYDGTVYYAYADQNGIIGEDSITDVALIKITPETALPHATLGDSSGLKYAQQIYAVGNPLGIGTSVTIGYISCPEREVITSGTKHTLIQMDAAVSPGNSGGGLFDAYGNLIGVVNSKSSGDGVEGIGYAIPVNTVIEVVDDLAVYGYVKDRAALGITVASIYSKDIYEYYKARDLSGYLYDYRYGLYVISSTNENADIKTGDRLTHFNGEFISSSATLTEYLLKCRPGDEVTLTLDRLVRAEDGGYSFESKEVKITLAERTW